MKKSNYSKLNWSLQRDLAERKEHFKMFKAGRTWLFAGVTVLFFGSGIFFNQISIQADTSSESSSVVAKTSTVSKDSTQTQVKRHLAQVLQSKAPVLIRSKLVIL